METHSEKQDRFLNGNGEWVAEDENAELRLEATLLIRQLPEVSNRIHRLVDGRWRMIENEEGLSAVQRGLMFRGWETAFDGRRLIAISGPRMVDRMMAEELLSGLAVYSTEGRRLERPELAGHTFLLRAADAQTFVSRLKRLGGSVSMAQPVPEEALEALQRIEQIAEEMQMLSAKDMQVLRAAQAGDMLQEQLFEAQTERYRDLLNQALSAYSDCRFKLAALQAPGRPLSELAQADQILDHAEATRDHCRALFEARHQIASALARLVHGDQASTRPRSPAARAILLRDLAAWCSEQGLQISDQDGALVIETPGSQLHLSETGITSR